MSITSLYLPRPISRPPAHTPRDHARRDRAVELFERGERLAGIAEAIAYLVPGVVVPDLAREPLRLVQGSARLRLHVDGERLCLSTVLATLTPDSNAVAALRHFVSSVAGTGQLYQPRLRDDVVALEYADDLALMHPLKLIELLQSTAKEACEHDAWLVDSFGVAMSDREPIAPLAPDELDAACALWDAHWAATDAMLDELRRRRSTALLNTIAAYANSQIVYALPLHGSLREDLSEANDDYDDRDEHPTKRQAALEQCVKAMRQRTRDDLARSLGHATYAINPLHDGSPSLLTKVLSGAQREQTVGDLNAAGRTLESSLYQAVDYLYLLAYFVWPPAVAAALREPLDLASGRPLREAADVMRAHATALVRNFGGHGEDDDDGDDTNGDER
ncbi:MAG TPA: hypothetical protein VJ724_00010 [Tahibacter sp.]|nr:hypothetical protein [Tahibacter sp.]